MDENSVIHPTAPVGANSFVNRPAGPARRRADASPPLHPDEASLVDENSVIHPTAPVGANLFANRPAGPARRRADASPPIHPDEASLVDENSVIHPTAVGANLFANRTAGSAFAGYTGRFICTSFIVDALSAD